MSPAGWSDQRSGHWIGASADDIVGLHRGGHEIACHTFSHARAIASMRRRWRWRWRAIAAISSRSTLRSDWRISPIPMASRSTVAQAGARQGLPFIPRHPSRRQQRHRRSAFPARDAADRRANRPDGIDRAFDEAVATNGWLIFYSHDVRPRPAPTDVRRRCCATRWRQPGAGISRS